jgi:hypothetical protein
MNPAEINIEKEKVNLETSVIAWKELQRFFAAGQTIAVDPSLDLVEVALQVANDNAKQISLWMEAGQLGQVSDQQASTWFNNDREVWAVVVKPWVLVQADQ